APARAAPSQSTSRMAAMPAIQPSPAALPCQMFAWTQSCPLRSNPAGSLTHRRCQARNAVARNSAARTSTMVRDALFGPESAAAGGGGMDGDGPGGNVDDGSGWNEDGGSGGGATNPGWRGIVAGGGSGGCGVPGGGGSSGGGGGGGGSVP